MGNRLRFGAFVAVGLTLAVQLGAQQTYSKSEGDRFQSKLARITAFANQPAAAQPASASAGQTRTSATAAVTAGGTVQTTQLTDAELNSYLRFNIKNEIPVGIVEPTLNALGNGRVKGVAMIDLDAVRSQKQRTWTDPLSYMTGKMPLTASGLLITQNGVGRFQLEAAEISGITIPKTLVQELLTHYSRSKENPTGISMDAPFELPARIKEIRVGKGEAMVVQ